MALLIGIGVAELAFLAAATVTALYLATPAGQQAIRTGVKEISKALSRENETIDVAPPIKDCKKPCDPCPPCPQPPPPRTDIVPPSRKHFPCPGDHTHEYYYEPGQNPTTCKCFCTLKENVICH